MIIFYKLTIGHGKIKVNMENKTVRKRYLTVHL